MASEAGPVAVERFVREDGLAGQIAHLVEPVLVDLGFRLVRVRVTGQDGATVQVMAERPDGTMTIDDCAVVSRQLSPVLDVHDPLPGRYRLEISSPGIDRPLVCASDFVAWKGHEARLETREMFDGRKRFRGTLVGFEEGEVLLEVDLPGVGIQVIGLRLDLLSEAKLVLTDALVRETLRRSGRAEAPAAEFTAGEEGSTEGGGATDPQAGARTDGNVEPGPARTEPRRPGVRNGKQSKHHRQKGR
jgi:ribosome maturation factor RimP